MLLLLLLLLGGAPVGGAGVRLSDCLQDDDYDQLLQAVQTGLPPGNTSQRVVVVGAGVAGLTAAKLLQDAGHQVDEGGGGGPEGGACESATFPPELVCFWHQGDGAGGERACWRTRGDLQEPTGRLVRRPGRHEDPQGPPVSLVQTIQKAAGEQASSCWRPGGAWPMG